MILIKFILRTCRGRMVVTTLMALLSGACNAGLIALVNTALTSVGPAASVLIWTFVGMGMGKVLTNFVSQAMLASFSQGAIAQLRRDLIRKILRVPLRQLEEIGTARILVALTDDVFSITQALLAIPVNPSAVIRRGRLRSRGGEEVWLARPVYSGVAHTG